METAFEAATGQLGRRTVNSVQAAEIAEVTRRTIYNWVRWGWVEAVYTPSGGVRIFADTLLVKGRKGIR